MLSAPGAIWSFSTARLPPHERARALHGLRERGILPLEPLPGLLAHAEITKWTLPGIRVMSGTLGGLRQIGSPHTPGITDDVLLGVNLAGESAIHHLGREVTLRGGDALLFSGIDGGFIAHRPTTMQFLGLRLPHKDLAPLVSNLDDAVMRLIPRDTGSLRLLATYLRCIVAGQRLESPKLGHAVTAHVHHLIALSIGASRDTIVAAQTGGVRAARLLTIKADIDRNYADPGLAVSAVAVRHGVTPRYVHRLFEDEGVTFSEFVLARRLTAAYRLLTDQRSAYRPIASVAYDVGFSDLSYFNRTFRRQYHATPTEVRSRNSG
jgi:AraC-like DNA-binding protein